MGAPDQSVRQLMNQNGYDNSKIGYDQNSNYVTYNGKNFMQPDKVYNGTSYTSNDAFNQAHQQYQQSNPYASNQNNPYQGSIFHPQDDNVPYAQRLINYATDPTSGQAELDRSQKALNVYNALGDQTSAASAQAHIARVMAAMGQNANQNPQDKQINDLVSGVMQQINNPQPFDVYSSPQYQAALAQQNMQSQLATRAAQESMGESGFGRSTNLADRAQQIQNDKSAYLMSQVVPGIIQQHQAQQQQHIQDLMGMISPLMQQRQNQFQNNLAVAGLTGQYNGQQTMAGQQEQAALTGKLADGSPTYAAQQQQIQNAIARANAFGQVTSPEDAQLLGVPQGTTTRELQALMYKNQYQNNMLGLKQEANDIARIRAGNQSTVDAARANYYNSQVGNAKNSQANNEIAGQVFDHAQEFQSAKDVQDYFNANGAYLAQHIGADATAKLKNDFLSQFNQDNKQATSTYDRAFSAAQRDADWMTLSPEDQNARINKYLQMLQNKGNTGN